MFFVRIGLHWQLKMLDYLFSPILSLFSPRFYKRIQKSSVVAGFIYLVYLSIIYTIVFLVHISLRWIPIVEDTVSWFARAVPPITYQKREFSSPVKQPFTLKHPMLGTVMVIDTSKETATAEEIKKTYFFITKKLVYVTNPIAQETQVVDLSSSKVKNTSGEINQTFTGKMIVIFYKRAKPVFLVVLFVLAGGLVFLWKLSAAFISFLIAVVMNQFRERMLPSSGLFNTSAFAVTFVVFLQMLDMIAPGLHLMPPTWMAVLMTSLYLGFAILVIAPSEKSGRPLGPSI